MVHVPKWKEIINHVLNELDKSNKSYKLILDIYNPDSIVQSVYFAMRNGNPDYLPLFLFLIDYTEQKKTTVYEGKVLWSGSVPSPRLLNKNLIDILMLADNEIDAILMGLSYTVEKVELDNDKEISSEFILIEKGATILDVTEYSSIENFIEENQEYLALLINKFNNPADFI